MGALHITMDNFEEKVLGAKHPVLIDFFANWCGPCKMLVPVIDELADELEDVTICKINVDDEPELTSRFQIMSIPALVVIKDGQIVNSSVGVRPKSDILDMIKFS